MRLIIFAAAIAALAASPCWAQQSRLAGRQGSISRQQFTSLMNRRFDKRDTNHDGVLSKDDASTSSARLSKLFAAKPDSEISESQYDAMSSKIFDRMDTNHDGEISQDERSAFRSQRGGDVGGGSSDGP